VRHSDASRGGIPAHRRSARRSIALRFSDRKPLHFGKRCIGRPNPSTLKSLTRNQLQKRSKSRPSFPRKRVPFRAEISADARKREPGASDERRPWPHAFAGETVRFWYCSPHFELDIKSPARNERRPDQQIIVPAKSGNDDDEWQAINLTNSFRAGLKAKKRRDRPYRLPHGLEEPEPGVCQLSANRRCASAWVIAGSSASKLPVDLSSSAI